MGRLIDADVLMTDVRNTITEKSGALDWINLINRQPTAYDPDKVVEQLEEYLFEKYCVEGDVEIDMIVKAGGME